MEEAAIRQLLAYMVPDGSPIDNIKFYDPWYDEEIIYAITNNVYARPTRILDIDNPCTRLTARAIPTSVHTTISWPARRAFLAWLSFLVDLPDKAKPSVVVCGFIPTDLYCAINLLAQLYPSLKFHLYGTKHVFTAKNIRIHDEELNAVNAMQWNKLSVLFISELVGHDDIQNGICEIISPFAALLRFSIPNDLVVETVEIIGKLVISPWETYDKFECYIDVRTLGVRKTINVTALRDSLFYKNVVIREWSSPINADSPINIDTCRPDIGIDNCADCMFEIAILTEFISSRKKDIKVHDLMSLISNKLGGSLICSSCFIEHGICSADNKHEQRRKCYSEY